MLQTSSSIRPEAAEEAGERWPVLGPAALAVACGALVVPAAFRPKMVLLVGAGLGVVLVALARTDVALLILVATAPLEGALSIGGSSQITVVKLAGLLCLGSLVVQTVVHRRPLRFDRTHALILVLLGVALLSMLQARSPDKALAVTARYASFVFLYVVVSQFVGDRPFLTRLAWVLSLSCGVASFLALRNFFSGATLLANLPGSDPNDVAFILATTLPLTFWLLRSGWLQRALLVVVLMTIVAGVLLTFSRGALVGIAAGVVWVACTERRYVPPLVLCAVLALVTSVVLVRRNPETVTLGLSAKKNIAVHNVESRLDMWAAAVQLAADRPLLGVGPGNFSQHYVDVADRPAGLEDLGVVHNAYLDVAAELGITGLVLFVAFLGISFSRLNNAIREGKGPPGFAVAVRAALVIAVVGALTLSEQYYAPFWVLGGLATALYHENTPAPVPR